MLFDFRMPRHASAWLLAGLIAAAGCSSEPDKGTGSSASGATASSGKPAIGGEVPSAGTSSSGLMFPSESKQPEFAAPDTPPPIAPPDGGAARAIPAPDAQPITAPPDVPLPAPASSGSAKPTTAPPARQPGDPIFAPPERPK
jgi:hypothetical protein